jgi:hypothetical protein
MYYGIYMMGHVYTWIYHVYTMYIHDIGYTWYIHGYTTYSIPGILVTSAYAWDIHGIYQAYTGVPGPDDVPVAARARVTPSHCMGTRTVRRRARTVTQLSRAADTVAPVTVGDSDRRRHGLGWLGR